MNVAIASTRRSASTPRLSHSRRGCPNQARPPDAADSNHLGPTGRHHHRRRLEHEPGCVLRVGADRSGMDGGISFVPDDHAEHRVPAGGDHDRIDRDRRRAERLYRELHLVERELLGIVLRPDADRQRAMRRRIVDRKRDRDHHVLDVVREQREPRRLDRHPLGIDPEHLRTVGVDHRRRVRDRHDERRRLTGADIDRPEATSRRAWSAASRLQLDGPVERVTGDDLDESDERPASGGGEAQRVRARRDVGEHVGAGRRRGGGRGTNALLGAVRQLDRRVADPARPRRRSRFR